MKVNQILENATIAEIKEWLYSNNYAGARRISKKEIASGYFCAHVKGYQDNDYFTTEKTQNGYNLYYL